MTDTPQQRAVLRRCRTARTVRARYGAGTRVDSGVVQGTVVRHVPGTNAQGGYLVVAWDNGHTGRITPGSVQRVPVRSHRNDDPRAAVHGEGRIGGPCHAVTTRGHYCTKAATVVATDGWGYCRTHNPEHTPTTKEVRT